MGTLIAQIVLALLKAGADSMTDRQRAEIAARALIKAKFGHEP